MKRLLLLVIVGVILVPSGVAPRPTAYAQQAGPTPNQEGGDWYVVIDTTDTPLAKQIEASHEKLSGKAKRELNKKEKPPKQDNKGRTMETRIILDYEDAEGYPDESGQKAQGGLWTRSKLKPQAKVNKDWKATPGRPGTYNPNRDGGATEQYSAFLPKAANNDDTDCLDLVTGAHRGGTGKAEECYADLVSGTLLQTLIDSGDGVSCHHQDDPATAFPLDECEELNWTTLIESVDEDGPEDPDADGDGLEGEDPPDGINNDGDCMETVQVRTDDQGNPVYDLQWYGAADCTDAEGNPIPDRFPLIDEDGEDPIDNDGDGEFDEDGAGAPGTTSTLAASETDTFKQQCEDYYAALGVPFEDGDFDEETGECDLDKAMVKAINKKSEKEHGKWVFKDPSDPDPDKEKKEKWDDSEALPDQTPQLSYTFPKKGNYTVSLTVANSSSGVENTCSKKVKVSDKGKGKVLQDNCPSDPSTPPVADFDVSCEDLTCELEAVESATIDRYEWSLGKTAGGDHEKSQGNAQAFDKGKERRQVTVVETMVVHCQPGWEYEEDPDSPPDQKKVRCKKPVAPSTLQVDAVASMPYVGDTDAQSPYAMMGFTFSPPVIEWGWKVEEEVCIFGWCFEVFYARVGYRFDLAAGLRLPVEVEVTNFPEAGVYAENSYTFEAQLTPVDFDRADYETFCEQHSLDDLWYIDSCGERFSFPDFLDSTDGDEFVANYHAEAGVFVRVLSIPLITWGIKSGIDLAQSCTMWKLYENLQDPKLDDMYRLLSGAATGEAAEALKDLGILCGSFTTPFGYDEEGNPHSFPFIPATGTSFELRADCAEALARNEIVWVGGEPVPLCTGLILGIPGASLGIGLGIDLKAGAENIQATWTASRDAVPGDGAQTDLRWSWLEGQEEPPSVEIGPVTFDNYDLTRDLAHDNGVVEIDDFEYCLNIWVELYARLMFGGILSPIPDLDRFTIYRFSFGDLAGPCLLPLPQHAGTEGLQIRVPVENYGLEANAAPDSVPVPEPDTSAFEATFDVTLTNLGSQEGNFDNFRADLSNVRDQAPPYDYGMDRDNDGDGAVDEDGPNMVNDDHDCIGPGGSHHTGAICENDGYVELIDEDPPNDDWKCAFADADPASDDGKCDLSAQPVGPAAPYDDADPITLTVVPFQHGMTRPGLYPVRIWADSVEAKAADPWQLAPRFPGDPALFPYPFDEDDHVYGRWGDVLDVAYVQIEAFYDPQVNVTPYVAGGKPGVPVEYSGTFVNGGNEEDSMTVTTSTIDWNKGGCSLTTLGTLPGCPYRAVPTYIPEEWMDDQFTGDYGPFGPCQGSPGHISVLTAPEDWAGMTDTAYQFVVTAQSHAAPDVRNVVSPTYTVQATKESMTRYIGLEIEELIGELEEANAQGVHTCGLLPIVKNPIKRQNDRALELILSGKLDQASKALAANAHIVEGAFLHAIEGCDEKIPEDPWLTDWRLRGQALLGDLLLAAECTVGPAR